VPDRHEASTTVVIGRFDGLVRYGLREALRQDSSIQILATDLDGAALERTSSQLAARVIVVDEAVELALLANLTSSQPAPGVLLLANDPSQLYRTLLLALGVMCLARAVSIADLCAAVHAAAGGEHVLAPGGGRSTESSHEPNKNRRLTRREKEVFALLREGKSYSEIALRLHISYETVRTHAIRIRKKLGVSSRLELVAMPFPHESDTPT
jgi:DNA-binding NarL/FixJ family response regulator